jgi:dipeptidyl aminopeptidase/acylaminoacyl peptidase
MAGAALAGMLLALSLAACGETAPDIGQGGKLGETTIAGAKVDWGEPSNGDPIALLMLLPGGGWQRNDAEYQGLRQAAKQLQGQGYATVPIEYDAGAKGFSQIEAVYQVARKRYPNLPICVTGLSAGGNLGLMLATREPDLACVSTLAAPTDLTTIAQQDPTGDEAYVAAVKAFGPNRLAEFSPVKYASKIQAKVQMFIAETDPLVPVAQGEELKRALPSAQLNVVPPGSVPVPWAHYGGVPEDAQNKVITQELDFIKAATQKPN